MACIFLCQLSNADYNVEKTHGIVSGSPWITKGTIVALLASNGINLITHVSVL